MEIREPFGSGIVRYLGTEAIRQIPPRPRQTLFGVSFRERKRSCRSFAPRTIILQCTVVLRSGSSAARDGYEMLHKGCELRRKSSEEPPRDYVQRICYRPCALKIPGALTPIQNRSPEKNG